ncbi:MAG: YjbH domain-containing protein, partial [Alphaproteobacteria bacterium]
MQISSVETNADEVRIYLATGLRRSSPERQLEAARLAAAIPAAGNRITLIERRNGIIVHQVTLTRDEIKNRILVDNLFDNLEAKGFTIDSIDISHARARLVMTHVPELDGDVEHVAANIIFNAVPTPLQQVEIVQMDGRRQLSRAVVLRRDIRRTAIIDQMFDGLEASGYTVESLDLSKGVIRVHLSDALEKQSDDRQAKSEAAAQLVADHAPDGVSSVEIIQMSAGIETARVTLRRTAKGGLTAGVGSKNKASDEFIPALTDNEKNDIALKIFKGLEAANFTVDKFEISRRKATVFVTPTKFREHARNVGRASRVVASHAPDSIEEIEIVTMNAGLETARVSIMRRDLEAGVQGNGSPEEIWAHTTVSGPKASPPFTGDVAEGVTAIRNPLRYPTLSWKVRPAFKSHIGGPDSLYLYQIWMSFSASAELYRGLSFVATFGKNIKSTLDE